MDVVAACRFADAPIFRARLAIKEAAATGRIAQSRYESYCRILLASLAPVARPCYDTRRSTAAAYTRVFLPNIKAAEKWRSIGKTRDAQ